MCRVSCGHCFDSFLYNTLNNKLARCPFCRKLSSVGPEFARTRGIVFLLFFMIFLGGAIGVTFGTHSYLPDYKGLIALYIGLYLLAILFFGRSLYYLTMKVSTIELGSS
jgi:phosphatidylinositol-4,5-bisphosphate 4-phosphatase